MVEKWARQSTQEHVYQLSIRQRRMDSSRKISPLLGIIFEAPTGTHRHDLKLCTGWSEVSIVLILPVERSSQILPVVDVGSLQLIETFQLSPL